ELTAGGTASPLGPRGSGVPTDALPVDVHASTGRVLLASYSAGLFELESGADANWTLSRQFPGPDQPTGLFGDAAYQAADRMVAILYAKGLLRLHNGEGSLFGPEQGLLSPNLLRAEQTLLGTKQGL